MVRWFNWLNGGMADAPRERKSSWPGYCVAEVKGGPDVTNAGG